mgnify:CR=1 FL=1
MQQQKYALQFSKGTDSGLFLMAMNNLLIRLSDLMWISILKKLQLFRSVRPTDFNFTPTVLKFSEVLQNDIR